MIQQLLDNENIIMNNKSKSNIINMDKIKLNKNGIPEELENSLIKIVTYSEIDHAMGNKFIENMNKFRLLHNKSAIDPTVREIKKSIELVFFNIYEKILKRTIKENNTEKIYDMFLNYTYMDERLLTKDQIITLYCLNNNIPEESLCNTYTIRQWLEAIYSGNKEPSVDDFDLDYYDTFRELRKTGQITENEKDSYNKDQDRKLNFEIEHFFKKTQRLCCGQMGLYFPILYKDIIVGNIEKNFVSYTTINENIKNLLSIDFSLFYREIFCHDIKRGLEKEYIMKAIMPDIILIPTFGTKSVMWQPIAGRNKSNPARFVLPLFSIENIYDLIVRMCGIFRWELCKSIMGVAWADVTQKSLTSEYSDYIQFYRKNNELSNETKEKVRNQITKNRNMLKNIFTSDYELWIKYESKGSMRLNKVVRAIMFNYCTFSKDIREKIEKQVAFSEASKIYTRNKNKKIKSIENKMMKLSKTKLGIPKELEENLKFFKDM